MLVGSKLHPASWATMDYICLSISAHAHVKGTRPTSNKTKYNANTPIGISRNSLSKGHNLFFAFLAMN